MIKNKFKYILLIGFMVANAVFASNNCFILKHYKGPFVTQEGTCAVRYSPCSTFKIAISLMGYEEKILNNELQPAWPFLPLYFSWHSEVREACRSEQTPTSWMKNSCIWYSQKITQGLGKTREQATKKFAEYLQGFKYGNQDISGDKGKDNGLTHAWLTSSLEISPLEQIAFLEKLIADELPLSSKAQADTRSLLLYEDTLPNGWTLYGKTGSGHLPVPGSLNNSQRQIGWFVGWISKSDKTLVFTQFIENNPPQPTSGGVQAREQVIEKLKEYLATLD